MRLAVYLLRLMAGRILGALAALVGVLQIIDLLDITPDILDRNLGLNGVVHYALLRLPRLIEQAAPLAVLAGGLFAFAKLAGESAITAMRSSGISAYRITVLALPAALALALVQLTIGQVIAPRTDEMLTAWWQASAPPPDRAKLNEPVTFRLGPEIVTAKLGDPNGGRLTDVVIYHRDTAGRLTQRTSAASAVYDGKEWQLMSPSFEMLAPLSVKSGAAKQMNWIQRLRPADVQTLMAAQPIVTPSEAQRALEGGVSVRSRTFYDTQVQRAWAGPVACLVMLLLAAPAALANFRGGAATMIVQSLATGLLFMVVDGAFTALGESGAAPAVLAAWAAPAMFSALGVTALLYREG